MKILCIARESLKKYIRYYYMSKNKTNDKKSGVGASGTMPLANNIGDKLNDIVELFKQIKKDSEFEFIFFGKRGKYLPQEKYIELLNFFSGRAENPKYKLTEPENTLDITYQPDIETNMRCTLSGTDTINSLMKKVSMFRNHVAFKTLVDLWKKKTSGIEIIKKEKKSELMVDVEDLEFRARLSTESKVTDEEIKKLLILDETNMTKIKFRYKQRTSLYIMGDDKSDDFVRIDLTYTRMAETYKRLNSAIPNYELEIEYGTKSSPNIDHLMVMLSETELMFKIIQQSNFITTKSTATKVISFYKNLLSIDPEKQITNLEGRQPVTLEIQHVTGELVNKYAVTDKADGERHFLIILENHVYFITNNLDVKDTGIILEEKLSEYNGTLLDGELIFISNKNRHIFLTFDCLFHKSIDVRPAIKLMERIAYADDVIEKCFIFTGQKGFKIGSKKFSLENFNLDKKLVHHHKELVELMNTLNADIEVQKKYPLIRRKYFIEATGGKDWEIFSYASALWNSFLSSSEISCPYFLDGLIFQPLEQSYAVAKKDNKLLDYKWKPPEKNSIDFYVEFEKDQNGKIITVYDNSRDDNSKDDVGFIRNKPYKICKLYVGQQNKGTEVPVLFKEEQELYLAYMYLVDGEVRDIEGNIISDKTVIEAYYNDDPEIMDKFRWVCIRTRYDKTESVTRYGRKYGNYNTVADKVWRSITNPVLMSDFEDLAKGNNPEKNIYTYNKKMESLRQRISHELIISTTKESAYFQQRTNLAQPMRWFINWIKDEMIWTFCHPMYQDNRQLSVLDFGCGKGQDIMKWFFARALFYVGLDLDREGLVNPVDGANSRYNQLKKRPNFPKMNFLQADCTAELDVESQKNALNLNHLENEEIYKKFFSKEQNKRTQFDRINCQLAIHYMLRNEDTWSNFKKNINGYLRNGGYFLALTFDGRKVMELLGDKDNYVQYYTDENGKSKMLFEIVKKYEQPKSKNDVIGVGNPIDVYIAWFSLEGRYLTEYLVDSKYIVNDLAKDCNLELISTDSCENQLIIHEQYLNNYAKYEDIPETRKFLSNVAQFYTESNVNVNCRPWLNLFRYYVFRKNSKLEKQKGGNSEEVDELLNFSDSSKYAIPEMTHYNNEFSCTNSLHHIMKSHKVIPKYITPQKFYSDLGIGSVRDTAVDDKIQKIARDMVIYEIVEDGKETKVVDGVNIFIVERDCNDMYDVNLVKKSKKSKDSDLSVILMKEGLWYVPVYHIDKETDKKIGLFENNHPIIKKLLEEV